MSSSVSTPPAEYSAEYAALLREARAADFSGWERAGAHNRALSVVGRTRGGASVFVFAPAVVLQDRPQDRPQDPNYNYNYKNIQHRLLLYFLREAHAIIAGNPAGYVLVLHAATFGRAVASFLRRVYRLLGRAFKKNIRHLLILHPTARKAAIGHLLHWHLRHLGPHGAPRRVAR